MKFTAEEYAKALYLAVSESRDQDRVLDNFVLILKQNGDLGLIDELEREFYKLERVASGVKLAEVHSATPLSAQMEAALIDKLNRHVGGKVELKQEIDQGLLGGVVIRVDEELMDGSLKKNLQELKKELIK